MVSQTPYEVVKGFFEPGNSQDKLSWKLWNTGYILETPLGSGVLVWEGQGLEVGKGIHDMIRAQIVPPVVFVRRQRSIRGRQGSF